MDFSFFRRRDDHKELRKLHAAHVAVLEAKIEFLNLQLESGKEEIVALRELAEDLRNHRPTAPRPKRQTNGEELLRLDPSSNEQLVQQVLRETAGAKIPANQLLGRVERLRAQVIEAQMPAFDLGTVTTSGSPDEVSPQQADVLAKINAALEEGKNRAQGTVQ